MAGQRRRLLNRAMAAIGFILLAGGGGVELLARRMRLDTLQYDAMYVTDDLTVPSASLRAAGVDYLPRRFHADAEGFTTAYGRCRRDHPGPTLLVLGDSTTVEGGVGGAGRRGTRPTTRDSRPGRRSDMMLPELVRHALAEDVGHRDVTTEATVPAGRQGAAVIRAKQELVVCGHEAAAEVFRQVGARYEVQVAEGRRVEPGTVIARVSGSLRAMLIGERLALNFLMRLCGIATHTWRTVSVAPDLKVVDTRKTTPLHRALERRAVRVGGASNHRFALYDGILIKDNHIAAAGGIAAAVQAARSSAHHLLRIEIEVGDLDELRQALDAGVDAVLLDNMTDEQLARAVALARAWREAGHGRVLVEASGNMSAGRLPAVARTGVDLVSMGGLIHQATWADLSMKIEAVDP